VLHPPRRKKRDGKKALFADRHPKGKRKGYCLIFRFGEGRTMNLITKEKKKKTRGEAAALTLKLVKEKGDRGGNGRVGRRIESGGGL